MPFDQATTNILTQYLTRALKEATMTRQQVNQISLDAFAKMQAGVTVTSTTFEGGGSSAQINCNPADLMAAAEAALAATDPSAVGVDPSVIYPDFSKTRIET